MKVTANKAGFDGEYRKEGESFDFDVVIRPDGSNNLGSWMDLDEGAQKELEKLTKAATKKPSTKKAKSKAKANDEPEELEKLEQEVSE